MYKDKLLTLFQNLNGKFAGLAGYLSDRNLILKSILTKEMREDFLLKERIQSMDEVSGSSVTALAQNVDLTPVNELMPSVSAQAADESDDEVAFAKGGVVGTSPIIDVASTSLGSEPTNEPYQSLEESGATAPLDEAASAIVEDFQIDKKFKKAFSEALALPAKAAAVGLTDLISKTPSEGKGDQIRKTNINKLSAAFDLPKPELQGDERDPEDQAELDRAQAWVAEQDAQKALPPEKEDEEDKRTWSKPSSFIGKMLALGMRGTGHKDWAAKDPNDKGAVGDPLIPNPVGGYIGTGYVGDGKGFFGKAAAGIKKAGKLAFDMSPVGIGMKMAGGAKNTFKNITQNKHVKGFLKGAGGFAKKAFKYTPMGMAATAGSKIFNMFKKKDEQTTNLNELTENVINDNRQSIDEKTAAATKRMPELAKVPVRPTPAPGSMDQGSDEAIPKIKYSPYFDEYTITSQF